MDGSHVPLKAVMQTHRLYKKSRAGRSLAAGGAPQARGRRRPRRSEVIGVRGKRSEGARTGNTGSGARTGNDLLPVQLNE